MFTVYHSNQLALLKTLMAELIKREPLASPFDKEIILVQSSGMAQWLQIELAQEMGIMANADFLLPARFIWQLYCALEPNAPKVNQLDRPHLVWKMMAELPAIAALPSGESLAYALSDETACYQLALRMADLFDQYQVYRADWLRQWEAGKQVPKLESAQECQALIWRTLVSSTIAQHQSTHHRGDIHQTLISLLMSPTLDRRVLPKRLFICGISSLPPIYLAVLSALSQLIPVHFMFTNPCRWYWGEAVNPKQAPLLLPHAVDETRSDVDTVVETHALLGAWGKLGQDYLYLLQDIKNKQDIDAFVELDDNTLLSSIQQDMLVLRRHSDKVTVSPDDHSLQIHCCHSIVRELEVLHDNLLQMMDADPTLMPRDILIMVADIDAYAPYIQAIFSHPPPSRLIPYSISDRRLNEHDPLIRAFFILLELPNSRCTIEEMMALLSLPALAEKFGIDEDKRAHLKHWVRDSGIHWGIDESTQHALDLPATGKNTWQFGLMRMLLGYAMDNNDRTWADILPYDETNGLRGEWVGELVHFIDQIAQWRRILAEPKCLSEWRPICQQLIDAFFITNAQTEPIWVVIDQAWQQMIDTGEDAHYSTSVGLDVVADMLNTALKQVKLSHRFLAGKMNFCTLTPMRSIPFKVVCLLGMNDGVYPRMQNTISIDLMSAHFRRGDRSHRDDDCYLFLEALLSAQHTLYISYIGYNIQDNTPRYPSNLVAELITYVTEHYQWQASPATATPLVTTHTRMPFDAKNFHSNSRYQSYANEWLPAAKREGCTFINQTPLLDKPIETLALTELKQFYRHTVRGFFQQRLGIYFDDNSTAMSNDEPFTLSPLQRYQLRDHLLNQLIARVDRPTLTVAFSASGMLPYGARGELILDEQYTQLTPLVERVHAELLPVVIQEVDLSVAGVRLLGWLDGFQQTGLLRWRAGALSVNEGMMLWIDHLVACAMGLHCDSKLLGIEDQTWSFCALAQAQAQTLLAELVDGYTQGMTTPLLLPMKSAWSWLTACYHLSDDGEITYEEESSELAVKKLIAAWQGNAFKPGEGNNYYYQRLITVLDEPAIGQITAAAMRYLHPLLVHGRY